MINVSFPVVCPNCGKNIDALEEWIGTEQNCPRCEEGILIRKDRRLQASSPIQEQPVTPEITPVPPRKSEKPFDPKQSPTLNNFSFDDNCKQPENSSTVSPSSPLDPKQSPTLNNFSFDDSRTVAPAETDRPAEQPPPPPESANPGGITIKPSAAPNSEETGLPKDNKCPVCSHKLGSFAKLCIYCGTDLTKPLEDQIHTTIDIVKGEDVHLLSGNGKEIMIGKLNVKSDGFCISGYVGGNSSVPTPGASAGAVMGDLAARTAISVAISAVTLPTIGVAFVPKLSNLGGSGDPDEPERIEYFVSWDTVESLEYSDNDVGFTTNIKNKSESFKLVLVNTLGGADKCHEELYNQLVKYQEEPDEIPRCPGCDRILSANHKRCMYCGAERPS